jgi:hypothetical protein
VTTNKEIGLSRVPIKVLLFQDSGTWIAEALGLDVEAQGAGQEEAIRNLYGVLVLSDKYRVEVLVKEPLPWMVLAYEEGREWEAPEELREIIAAREMVIRVGQRKGGGES